jgi:hypothetical protein
MPIVPAGNDTGASEIAGHAGIQTFVAVPVAEAVLAAQMARMTSVPVVVPV